MNEEIFYDKEGKKVTNGIYFCPESHLVFYVTKEDNKFFLYFDPKGKKNEIDSYNKDEILAKSVRWNIKEAEQNAIKRKNQYLLIIQKLPELQREIISGKTEELDATKEELSRLEKLAKKVI